MKKINLPKSIIAVAGASTMIFSTGFISGQPEVKEFETVKVEESQSSGSYKSYYCETAGEYYCLPTHEVDV
ncbi:hypothetical protein [Algoriphagus sp.]|uniref:hypothetical protein n=1 Tax=Algoriphagus sp. TaxID=1872435 RepID=UPI003F70A1F2